MVLNFNDFFKKIRIEANYLLKKKKWPISIIPGVLVIVFFYAFTLISIAFYPAAYSPLNNLYSDLGDSNYNPNGAFFFNLGCILTGIMLFPFYFGMSKFYREENLHKLLVISIQIVGCCSGFALIMLGFFPSEFPFAHMIWAGAFFWLNTIVLLVGNIALHFHKDFIKTLAFYGWSAAGINILFVFLMIFGFNTPLLEWISVSTALGYVALLEFNRYKTLE